MRVLCLECAAVELAGAEPRQWRIRKDDTFGNLELRDLAVEEGAQPLFAQLLARLRAHDRDRNFAQPFVASCGSGVTAAALVFAAHLLGSDKARLYDGSWSEWGADPATPKELGPAA